MKRNRLINRTICMALAIIIAFSCQSGLANAQSNHQRVNGVELNKSARILIVGEKETLEATVLPETAKNQKVQWSTSNKNIAKVDKNGTVTAVKPGIADIEVKTVDGKWNDTCEVTVLTLIELKQKAHDLLQIEYSQYHASDYTSANWNLLCDAKAAGDGNIEAANDHEGVDNALNQAVAAMAAVPETAPLEQAKLAAHEKLNQIFSMLNGEDYDPAYWYQLAMAKMNGDSAIDSAVDAAGVETALNETISALQLIPVRPEVLDSYKVQAQELLEAAYDAYTESDYTPENWAALTSIKTTGVTAIGAAADIWELKSVWDTAINAMAAVQTRPVEELKAEALAAIQTIFNGYTQSDYTPENWAALAAAKEAGETAVGNTVDAVGVRSELNIAISSMSAIPTKYLTEAKNSAITQLEAAFSGYSASDYTPEYWMQLMDAMNSGYGMIQEARDTAEVEAALNQAIASMAQIPSFGKVLEEAKTTAHSALNSAYGGYLETNYTPDNWAILSGAKTAGDQGIDAAVDLAGVETALNEAVSAMAAVQTKSLEVVKAEAHEKLQIAYSGYNETDYSIEYWEELTTIKTLGDTDISGAVTLDGVNSTLDNALRGMAGIPTMIQALTHAKETAHNELDAVYSVYNQDRYTEANWEALTAAKLSGDQAIDAATELFAVDNALNQAIAAMDAVPKIEVEDPLAQAKLAAHEKLNLICSGLNMEDYDPAYWDDLVTAKMNGDSAIDSAVDAAGVETAFNETISALQLIPVRPEVLDSYKVQVQEQLEAAYAAYTESDYTPENWAVLTSIKTAGEAAIGAAANLLALKSALDTALNAMAQVPTI